MVYQVRSTVRRRTAPPGTPSGSRWHLDEVCTSVDGVWHWLWRAVDEYGFVLDILLQRHRDTDAAKTFLTRLLSEYDVPDRICTDKLASCGAAI